MEGDGGRGHRRKDGWMKWKITCSGRVECKEEVVLDWEGGSVWGGNGGEWET